MELNNINNTDNWGTTAARLNENFSKISADVEKAKNSSTRAKGLFASLSALKSAWPTPQVGDWAIVGNTVPGTVYKCTTAGTWSNTGQQGGGGEIDLGDYLTATVITDPTTII